MQETKALISAMTGEARGGSRAAAPAAAPETPSAQGQEGSPELLIRSLVGGPSAELLLDLERVLCREGGPGGAVRPLLKRLQQESQPFLLFLWTLDAPGPNKTLLLTALR